jgi:hypothetical protein
MYTQTKLTFGERYHSLGEGNQMGIEIGKGKEGNNF